jgi:phage shock protein PspC (stress-responsive transcriptional regulator)
MVNAWTAPLVWNYLSRVKIRIKLYFCFNKEITMTQKTATILKLKFFFEKYGFHVSSRLADKLGMRVTSVRLFFIYISFVTVGLGFGVYLTLAFWIRLKDLIRSKRTSVFDL